MTNPAEGYEAFMVPTLFRPWAEKLVTRAGAKPGERVLDLGCGTGIVARTVWPLVQPGGTVTGLDLSPGMLSVAASAANQEGAGAIEFREGAAESLPFAEGTFDLVLCQFALMFFPNRGTALSETRRVLRGPRRDGAAAGRILLSVFQGIERHPFYVALDQAIERRLGASGVREIFALGDQAGLRRLIEGAGLVNVRIEQVSMTARFPNPAGFLAGEIEVDTAAIPSMQHLDAAARREITEALQKDAAAPLQEVTRGDFVELPFHVHIALGERDN